MYVHTGELLGQPSPKSAGPHLPDWAKLYLKSVRSNSLKNLTPYIALFETITFHPRPLQSDLLKGPKAAVRISEDEIILGRPLIKQFLSEMERIRDARLYQVKNYKQLHESHRKLFQDVIMSFKKFKPKDLEPFLVEALLADTTPSVFRHLRQGLWDLAKRFVREQLPTGLSTRVTESEWYMQHAIFARLGLDLFSTAQKYQEENAAFRKKVEMEEKARAKRP